MVLKELIFSFNHGKVQWPSTLGGCGGLEGTDL